MSGHKKDEDEQKQQSDTDPLDDEIIEESRDWHEDYLNPQNIDVVDGQLTSQPKDHQAPQQ